MRTLTVARLALAAAASTLAFAMPVVTIASAASAQVLNAEAFSQLAALESPELSPDGRKLAAKVAKGGDYYLMTIPLDGGAPALVATGDYDLRSWRWVNNDWMVVTVGATVPFGTNGEAYATRALGVSADGKTVVTGDWVELLRDVPAYGEEGERVAPAGTFATVVQVSTRQGIVSLDMALGAEQSVEAFERTSLLRRARAGDRQGGRVTPFPLEGGRAGDGGGAAHNRSGRDANFRARRRQTAPGDFAQPAADRLSPPSQPFPPQRRQG